MKAIIIDDESSNTKLLIKLLETYCPEVDILGTADNVELGLELINNLKPQLLFLDIEIHNKNARDILKIINTAKIQVILVSAHDNYAIEMIEYNICYYLLKPLEITKLIAGVEKAKKAISIQTVNTLIPEEENTEAKFIAVAFNGHMKIISVKSIMYIEAFGNYTKILCADGSENTHTKPISYYTSILPKSEFFRVHNSYIVNITMVSKYLKSRNGTLVMTNGNAIPISASKREEIAKIIAF